MIRNSSYYIRNDVIYVKFYEGGMKSPKRLSTNKKATKTNIRYVERNLDSVISKLIATEVKNIDFEKFAYEVVELDSYERDEFTQKDYLTKIRLYIVPFFKNFSLEDIKPLDIEKWQGVLLKKLASQSVKRCKYILNMMLHRAEANGYIERNPMQYVRSFKVTHERQEPYTLDEMVNILKHAKGWFRPFIYMAFTSGLRVGELLGLQWQDIDYKYNAIYVNRTISKGRLKESSRNKNHDRFVIVPKFVLEMLEPNDNEYVFVNKYGKPFYEPKNIVKYYFKPLLEELGIPWKTLKATRHTYISYLRNAGIDKDFIQELVGHSIGSQVTDRHYLKLVANSNKADAINNVFETLQLAHN